MRGAELTRRAARRARAPMASPSTRADVQRWTADAICAARRAEPVASMRRPDDVELDGRGLRSTSASPRRPRLRASAPTTPGARGRPARPALPDRRDRRARPGLARARSTRRSRSRRKPARTPERVLLERGAISPDGLARRARRALRRSTTSTSASSTSTWRAANLVTSQVAKRYEALPVAFVGERALLVAMADPANVLAVDDIAILTGYEVRVAVAPPEDIAALIARLNRARATSSTRRSRRGRREPRRAPRSSSCTRRADDAPVVKLVNQLVGAGRRARRLRPAPRARRAAICACASASTACCGTSRPSRGGWPAGSSRA